MGRSTSAEIINHKMTASQTFVFRHGEIQQTLLNNTGTSVILIRDKNNIDFTIPVNGSWNISSVNGVINVSGITIITGSGGSCDIMYH